MFKIGRKHPTWHAKARTPKHNPFTRALGTDVCNTAGPSEATACATDWNQYQDTRAYQIEADRKRAMGVAFATRNAVK